MRVIATPGHTPEHLSYLLLDDSRSVALFSGGTLMSGGVARTDLLTPDQTEPLARAAYRSIRERLFILPEELVVYPTHGGGSFCSVGSGAEPTTTIRHEKHTNPLLTGDPDEDTFVERLTAGYGTYPPYFLELRALNRQGVEVFGVSPPTLPKLTVREVVEAMDAGAEVVDTRPIRAFSRTHIPDSISIPWRDQFATWMGWLVPRTSPVVFITDDSVDRDDLVWAALTVGFEELMGELDGGIAAWQQAGQSVGSVPVTDTDPGSREIVDVRQESEYRAGHLPGAIHVELGALARTSGKLPQDPLLVHCGHGERAMSAASLLARSGHEDVVVFEGSPAELGPLRTDASP